MHRLLAGFGLVFALLGGSALAEQSQRFGDYEVHYVAVNSNFLRPEIAAEYNIIRGPRRGFVNISVLHEDNGSMRPVTGELSGTVGNLLGQSSPLDFVEVREGQAIYYIAQFEFSNAETLNFNVEVRPESSGPARSLRWTNTMYSN